MLRMALAGTWRKVLVPFTRQETLGHRQFLFKVVIDHKFILDYSMLKILKTYSSVVDRVTVDIWNYTSTT